MADAIISFLSEASAKLGTETSIEKLRELRYSQLRRRADVATTFIDELTTETVSKRSARRLTSAEVDAISIASKTDLQKVFDWVYEHAVETEGSMDPISGWVFCTTFGVLVAAARHRAPSVLATPRYHEIVNAVGDFRETPKEDVDRICPESPALSVAAACDPAFEPMVGSRTLLQFFFEKTTVLAEFWLFMNYHPKLFKTVGRTPLMSEAIRAHARRQVPKNAVIAKDVLVLAEQMLYVAQSCRCDVSDLLMYGGVKYITEDSFAGYSRDTKYSAFGEKYAFLDAPKRSRDDVCCYDDETEETGTDEESVVVESSDSDSVSSSDTETDDSDESSSDSDESSSDTETDDSDESSLDDESSEEETVAPKRKRAKN